MSAVAATSVGQPVADLELSRAWLVDPAGGREGPGEIIVTNGVLEAVNWLEGDEAAGVDERGVVVAPAFTDLHAHFREPGNEAAETIATGTAAAAHGGFGTVCLMPNTDPRSTVERAWLDSIPSLPACRRRSACLPTAL